MRYIALLYAVVSVGSFVTYGVDKLKSRRGTWRIRERTLHVLDAAGGFPGGFAGQQFFKHKRRKGSFMLVYWMTVVAHVIGWTAWLFYR